MRYAAARTHRSEAGHRQSIRAGRKKFLDFFPDGFHDVNYLAWERAYKWEAHKQWADALGRDALRTMIDAGQYRDVAATAVRIESRTNLLFFFEKMAIRDAVSTSAGAKAFAHGIFDWLYGPGGERARFEGWCETVASLPRRQTRVLTWPVTTVFGFIARPRVHLFLKPMVTKKAAAACGFDFAYQSRPQWETYSSLLEFGGELKADLADLKPRDMIDIQSFNWVQGSDEYE
jgi:hypothetical protein